MAGVVPIAVLADRVRHARSNWPGMSDRLSTFVLVPGRADVVRALFTGSIMGTSLLGLAFFYVG